MKDIVMGKHNSAIKSNEMFASDKCGIILLCQFRRIGGFDDVQEISKILIPTENVLYLLYLDNLIERL